MVAVPYKLPNSSMRIRTAADWVPAVGVSVAPAPPRPVKIWPPVGEAPVAVDGMAEVVDTLTRLGFWAPHGWSCAQAAHAELPEQLAWHCETHSVQTKYGIVKLYSDKLGCLLSLQRQPYCSVAYSPGRVSLWVLDRDEVINSTVLGNAPHYTC